MGERAINPILNVHDNYRQVNILNPFWQPSGPAQSFIDATGITDPTQVTAINNLVDSLITSGVWTKLGAVYPFIGGTASTHKFNMKDPRDLDAAFRLVFFNSPTHNANGVTWNGTNQYANTFYQPSLNLAGYSMHMSYYSRLATPSGNYFMGCFDSGSIGAEVQYNGGTIYSDMFGNATGRASVASSGLGFIVCSRVSATDARIFRTGAQLVLSTTNNAVGALPSQNFVLGARNSAGTIQRYINTPCSFASMGEGLTPAEATAYSTAVKDFQIALGRNLE